MKEHFSEFPEMKNTLWVWLLVHLGIPVLLLLSIFFAAPPQINTLLMDMLPQSSIGRGVAEADKLLSEKNSREALIFASAENFEDAKKGAGLLCAEFAGSPKVEKLSLYFDNREIAAISEFFYDYRFVIAGKRTVDLLEAGEAGVIAEDALATAYGAFNFVSLDNIEKDPFLLSGRRMDEFLSSSVMLAAGHLGLKDEVLAANLDGAWHVLFRMTLKSDAVSLADSSNAVTEIYAAASRVKEAMPGLEFYFSGIPFHSYESSSGAQREVSLISSVTLIMLLAIFLFAFRSPLPVIFSILAALVSVGMGSAAALLVFREIHIITFVFGTTLIGTCVDYSIHFFVNWKGNPELKDGYAIRSRIFKSIIMCFVSSEVCFFVFLFAPFPILRQFAVFCMAGLFSSFLTACCVYPLLKVPAGGKREFKFLTGKVSSVIIRRLAPKPAFKTILFSALAASALLLIIFNFRSVKIENDITSLYTMSPELLESEKLSARIMDRGTAPWYFIVSGGSPGETLENEEALTLRLEEEVSRGNLGAYLASSSFVPSVKTQKQTYKAMGALLPMAGSQYEYLGFPPDYAALFYDEFAAGENYCLPENAPLNTGVANLWIGKAGDKYYSCVMPVKSGDAGIFRSIAGEFDFVFFINKAEDIKNDLNTITRTMVFLFLAAFIAISILVFIVYPRRDSVRICMVPVFISVSVLAVLVANKIPLGFFSVAGITLVFSLGLDYIFYMTGMGHEEHGLGSRAVLLSFLTTLLSFGALGLSSFVPAHIFGLTVSAGLCAAFISAMLLSGRKA